MSIFKSIAVATAISLSSTHAFAQAFGINQGEKIENLEVVEDLGNFLYQVTPPIPVSGFSAYVVMATPESGACMVRALGDTFERDGFGENIRSRFATLAEILDGKYGKGHTVDILRSGALWKDPDEWVMAIRQNERVFQAEWTINSEENGIGDIILTTRARSRDDSFLALQYRFLNIKECENAKSQKDASGL